MFKKKKYLKDIGNSKRGALVRKTKILINSNRIATGRIKPPEPYKTYEKSGD